MTHKSVKIQDIIYLFHEKAPYVKAGKSVMGALEYDPQEDSKRCHVCGDWFVNLSAHVKEHELTARQYKEQFGLRLKTSLKSEKTNKIMQAKGVRPKQVAICLAASKAAKHYPHKSSKKLHGIAELKNSREHCAAQLLAKLKGVAIALGHTPSAAELYQHGVSAGSLAHTFGTLTEAAKLANLKPSPNFHKGTRNGGGQQWYTDEQLLEFIRMAKKKNGGIVSSRTMLGPGFPSITTYHRRFGGIRNALRQAQQ